MASAMALAVASDRWDLAALCLALGVTEAASRLPPQSLEALLAMLEGPPRRQRD
ncbi:hypothetical protein HRbin25_00028 [bacterium HR25]|nr:hypothetical protein HRbin25_00028 [bacterium HR25]